MHRRKHRMRKDRLKITPRPMRRRTIHGIQHDMLMGRRRSEPSLLQPGDVVVQEISSTEDPWRGNSAAPDFAAASASVGSATHSNSIAGRSPMIHFRPFDEPASREAVTMAQPAACRRHWPVIDHWSGNVSQIDHVDAGLAKAGNKRLMEIGRERAAAAANNEFRARRHSLAWRAAPNFDIAPASIQYSRSRGDRRISECSQSLRLVIGSRASYAEAIWGTTRLKRGSLFDAKADDGHGVAMGIPGPISPCGHSSAVLKYRSARSGRTVAMLPRHRLGQLPGGPDVGPGGDAHQQAEVAAELPGRLDGVFVGHLDHLVDQRHVEHGGDEAVADALDLVQARLVAQQGGDVLRLDGHDPRRRACAP